MPNSNKSNSPDTASGRQVPNCENTGNPPADRTATAAKGTEPSVAKSEYVERLKKQLDEWSGDIAALEARVQDLSEDAKARLAALTKQYEEGKRHLEKIAADTEERWHDFTDDVERTWKALRNSVNYFRSHFRQPRQGEQSPAKSETTEEGDESANKLATDKPPQLP